MILAQQISQLRRAGRLDEALALAQPALKTAPQDPYLRRAAGWLFYDRIKRDVQAFQNQTLSRPQLCAQLDDCLNAYARGGKIAGPERLHSFLLIQVLKVSREWPRFLGFARWWDPANLQPEDRQPYPMANGKTLPSLERRLAYAIGRAVTTAPAEHAPDLLAWGVEWLDTQLAAHPDDPWLHYYQSRRLLALGRTAEAREHLVPVVRRQRQASWAWALLARTWEGDDADRAITGYFRALQVADRDVEVLQTRVALATLLARQGRFAEAVAQVNAARQCREANGYRIPPDLARLAATDWYRRYAALPNLTREPEVTEAANALLATSPEPISIYRRGVIDHHNPAKALAHVLLAPEDGAILRYCDWPDVADLPLGTLLELGFSPKTHHPVAWRRIPETSLPDLYVPFAGTLSRPSGQPFAFVFTTDRRIYVSPPQVAEMEAGTQVLGGAVMAPDKKRGGLGWKALWIRPEPLEKTGTDNAPQKNPAL